MWFGLGHTHYMFGFMGKVPAKKNRETAHFSGIPGEISLKKIKNYFSDCADLCLREVRPGGGEMTVTAVWIEGVSASLTVTDTVIRPLSRLVLPQEVGAAMDAIEFGGVYSCFVRRRSALADVCADITLGYTALVFDEAGAALSFETRSGDTRSVQQPTVEKSVLGAKDSFVENYRINTALVRR